MSIKDDFMKLLNEDHIINKKGCEVDLLLTKLAQVDMVLHSKSVTVIVPNGVLAQINGPDLKAMKFGMEKAQKDIAKIEEKLKNGEHPG